MGYLIPSFKDAPCGPRCLLPITSGIASRTERERERAIAKIFTIHIHV